MVLENVEKISVLIMILLIGAVQTKDYQFVETCFGGSFLVYNGYSYRKKSTVGRKSYWFCKDQKKCPARGILFEDGTFQLSTVLHDHKPNEESVNRRMILAKVSVQIKF